MLVRALALAAMLVLVFSVTAQAEAPEQATADPAAQPQTAPEISFTSPYEEVISQTRHSIGLQAGYGFRLWKENNHEVFEVLPYVTFPLTNPLGKESSVFRGVLEYKIEGVIGMFANLDDRIIAGGSPVGFKYDFTGLKGKLVPYADLMLGAVYANLPRDVQGSRFDFILSLGAGAQYFVAKRTTVNLQFRYWHLSDGGIKEPNKGDNLWFVIVGMGFY